MALEGALRENSMLGSKIAERNEREGPEMDQRKGTSTGVLAKPTSPACLDEAQMCSGLKLGLLIWKESSRRGLAGTPERAKAKCSKLHEMESFREDFGGTKTHYD